ncbi:MAG TPA: GNAT family N-acetyltransferase [Nakamurella sp.]
MERMELRTERTVIRPWRPEEADRLHDIVRRRDVTEWLGRPDPWTQEQVDGFIAGNQQMAQIPIRCAIVPAADPVPVGTVLIERFGNGDPHLGWFLHPDAWGRGWASEAAAAMLQVAIDTGADRVWAGMWPHNTGSAAVCRRIGLVDLGRQQDPWYGTIEYPLSRFFCRWRPDGEHPLAVLARLNGTVTREHATAPPPIGRDGTTYPGPD